MRKRISAAGGGVVVALGIYAAASMLSPTPARPLHPAPGQSSEVKPPAVAVTVVDPTPARLAIPAIGVDAKIEARGLDSDRNLATAQDFNDVAWYDLGPRPGEPSNAIVNGHVSWWTGDAVFTHLSRLRAGDIIRVTRADFLQGHQQAGGRRQCKNRGSLRSEPESHPDLDHLLGNLEPVKPERHAAAARECVHSECDA